MSKIEDELNKGHEIKGAASFMNPFGEIEVVEVKCTKENLLDGIWLFENIPWTNHSNKTAKINFNEIITLYWMDNYNIEFKSDDFNNVLVSAIHGFFGNSYAFTFMLDDKNVCVINGDKAFAFSKDDLKKRAIENGKSEIKAKKFQLNTAKEKLNKIKDL